MGVKEVNQKRIKEEALYMIETSDTIRNIAKKFKVSKSTVHKDLHERLKNIDYSLYIKVGKILQYHIKVRHLRGGQSTREKYLKEAKT